MTPLFQTMLALHVIMGVIGVIALYAIWLFLLKKTPSLHFLKWSSLTAFGSLVVSWLSGGYYYVLYYGGEVKPRIIEGDYAWAHTIFTETKEHLFLVLPFTALALTALFWLLGERVTSEPSLKRSALWLATVATGIGIFITLAGIIMSGGAR